MTEEFLFIRVYGTETYLRKERRKKRKEGVMKGRRERRKKGREGSELGREGKE